MRKWIIALITMLLVAAPAILAAQVKVGMITTLSGGGSALGVAVRDGFKLALEQEGGKLGGTPVELLVEDDAKSLHKLAKRMAHSDHDKPSALAVIVPNGYGYVGTEDVGVIPIGALGP